GGHSLWHVTIHTILGGVRLLVTACARIDLHRRRMRVVACGARHTALRRKKTPRLQKPETGMIDFEAIRLRGVHTIEIRLVVGKRFARLEGKYVTAGASQRIDDPLRCRLQLA